MATTTGSANPSSRLAQLSKIIAEKTAVIDAYLAEKGLPQPSFDPDGPTELGPIAGEDEHVHKARIELIDATKELRDLAIGPAESLRYLSWDSTYNNQSLRAIYHFKIASAFSANETISYEELSKRTGVDERNLRRICRHAMMNHIFAEPVKGTIAHTRASRLLAEDIELSCWTSLFVEDTWKVPMLAIDAMEKWPGSQNPLQTGIQLAFDTDKHWFEILGRNPEMQKRFGIGMKSFSEGVGFEVDYLSKHYPWGSLPTGQVVDVGSGIGHVSIILAKDHPNLKIVNQDLERQIATVDHTKTPEDLRDRISFQAYDFFQPQPVTDADVYFFRWIFHGWSDAFAVKILQSQIPALKKGARILINEWVLPDPGAVSNWDERIMRVMDLLMLTIVNSNERDVDDWRHLFEKADPRFTFLGASQPKGWRMWTIEAVWDPDHEFSEKDALPGAIFGTRPAAK